MQDREIEGIEELDPHITREEIENLLKDAPPPRR
jgi:hypothetical protein